MKKGIVVALAVLAMGLAGLFTAPAKGLQFGFNTGYTSVGFQLHGMGGEFLFGFQGQDEHRPQGSVLRIGLAGAAGSGETDLTKATWNGRSYNGFPEDTVATAAVQAARAQTITSLSSRGITGTFDALPPQQQALVDSAIALGVYTANAPAGAPAFTDLSREEQQRITDEAFQAIRTQAISDQAIAAVNQGVAQGLLAYGINDVSKAKGDATAFFVSAAYEYVLGRGAPGLGFIVGGELYVSQGSYASLSPQLPSVSTKGGIGGGGVVGISYYLKNGFNFTVKTGLGVIDPGTVNYVFPTGAQTPPLNVKVEPETVFYASPTFALGFIY